MAIPHGVKIINTGGSPSDPKRKPTRGTGRLRIEALKRQTMDTLGTIRSIVLTSFTTNGNGFYQLLFQNYVYENNGNPTYGFLDLENETELTINGVHVDDADFEVTDTGNDIVIDFVKDLGFTLANTDRVIFRARIRESV